MDGWRGMGTYLPVSDFPRDRSGEVRDVCDRLTGDRFLEKEIPDQEFPSGNTPAYMMQSYQDGVGRVIQTAWRNVGLTLLGMAGLLYAMGWQWGWECGVNMQAIMGYSMSF